MTRRLLKELRALLPPAALIAAATALSFAWSAADGVGRPFASLAAQIAQTTFILGPAFISASAFGAEFQHHTMVLLLSQPVSRSRIWLEKSLVLAAVVGVLGGVQLVLLAAGRWRDVSLADAITFLAAIVCSSAFWTLIARSTVGGLAFAGGAAGMAELVAEYAIDTLAGRPTSFGLHGGTPPLIALRIAYCLVMLWLGWRAFVRFEVRGAGDASPVNAATWRILRCQPTGQLRNLVRKEVALQRPTYQMALLFMLGWFTALAVLSLSHASRETADTVFALLLGMYLPVAIVVAGTISIGDDTTLGLRGWHLTLPASSARQWLVKLAVSSVAGALLGIALPAGIVNVTTAVFPIKLALLEHVVRPMTVVTAASGLALSFWASTLFGHTVRAAIGAGLVGIALAFSVPIAYWLGEHFDPGAGILTALIVRFHWTPDVMNGVNAPAAMPTTFLGVMLTVALAQSLSAFRRIQTDAWTIARQASALVGAGLLVFVVFASVRNASSMQRMSPPVRELRSALTSLRAPSGPLTQPRQIGLEELASTGMLSTATTGWLSGADISVVPLSKPGTYQATLRFPNKRKYLLVYAADPRR